MKKMAEIIDMSKKRTSKDKVYLEYFAVTLKTSHKASETFENSIGNSDFPLEEIKESLGNAIYMKDRVLHYSLKKISKNEIKKGIKISRKYEKMLKNITPYEKEFIAFDHRIMSINPVNIIHHFSHGPLSGINNNELIAMEDNIDCFRYGLNLLGDELKILKKTGDFSGDYKNNELVSKSKLPFLSDFETKMDFGFVMNIVEGLALPFDEFFVQQYDSESWPKMLRLMEQRSILTDTFQVNVLDQFCDKMSATVNL